MVRSCCSCVVGLKIVVWLVNFLIFMAGISAAIIASLILFNKDGHIYIEEISKLENAIEAEKWLEPWLTNWHVVCFTIIGIGLFILILGFVGCFGALRESNGMLSCQAILMLIIMLLEVAAIICGYIFYNKIEDRIKDTMYNYNQGNDTWTEFWDHIQSQGQCCGIDSALDWETSMINEGRSPNLAPSKPASCCPFLTESNVTNCVVGAENTFDKGCADYTTDAGLLGLYIIIGVFSFQIISIICTCSLRKQINREKYFY